MAKRNHETEHLDTRPCDRCGEVITIDRRMWDLAIHDCDTGEWQLIRLADEEKE